MMRFAFGLLALASIAGAACGGVEGVGGAGGTGGEGGGGAGGGGAGGSGGEGGSDTYACDHASPDGGLEAPTCAQSEVRLAGNLDGKPVDETFLPASLAPLRSTYIELGTFGQMYFPGAQAKPGENTAVRGLIRFPDESTRADAWYCVGEGSEVSVSSDVLGFTAALDSFSLLGSCETGTPVSGQIESCYYSPDCEETRAVSTVEGASFDVEIGTGYSGTVVATGTGFAGAAFAGPMSSSDPADVSGFVKIESYDIDQSEPNTPGTKMATLARGFLIVPAGEPDAGAVYCVGDGSTVEYRMEAGAFIPVRSTFKNLKRIGACAAATNTCTAGQLQICGDLHPGD